MSRLDDLKAQLSELDGMIQRGLLQGEAARQRRDELEAQVLAALADPAAGALRAAAAPVMPARRRPSAQLLAGITAFVLAVGAGGYAWLGNPAGLSVKPGDGAAQAQAQEGVSAEQIDAMVNKLAERLKTQPDDAQGWTMLARSYAMLGRHAEAVKAYAELARLKPQDAQVLADYADSMGAANGMKLEGEPEKLIERALQLDPGNLKALALSGTIAFSHGDAKTAAARWQKAYDQVPADSEIALQLRGAITEARQKAGLPPLPAASGAAPAGAASR